MSKCDFTFSIKQADEAQNIITKEIMDEGGNISFNDDGEGKFDLDIIGGKVAGNLTIQDEEVHVEITEKPGLIPCSAIESVIKSYL